MKVFVELQGTGNDLIFINILNIDYIIDKETKTKIMLSSGNSLWTSLSPKEIMKKIDIALGPFGNEEIIKKVTRAELIDMGD